MTETRIPSLAAIAQGAAVTEVAGVRVCRAAAVLAYYPDSQTADVQILPSDIETRTDGTLAVVDPVRLYGKPVAMPSGVATFTFGLTAGQTVYVVYRDVSHDEWDQRRDDRTYTPQDPRRFDPSDVIVWPFAHPPSRMDGAPVIAFGSGLALRVGAEDAAKAVAIAEAVRDEMDARDSAIGSIVVTVTGATPLPPATTVTATIAYVPPTPRALGSLRLLTDDNVTPGSGVTP